MVLARILHYVFFLTHPFLDPTAIGVNGEAVGFLVIYGDAGDHLNDGVAWQPQEKLNLKLIVKDPKTNRYKLRNSKNDDGEPVMRRHKRVANNKALGWERHEYKLFSEETAHRQNVDGTKSVVTRRTLNPWPILVHYFRPSVSPAVLRAAINTTSSSAPASMQLSFSPPSNSTVPRNGDDEEDAGEYQRITKRQKTGLNASRDAMAVNESDSENGSISSAGLSRALRSIQAPLFRGELAPIVNVRPIPTYSSSLPRPRDLPTLSHQNSGSPEETNIGASPRAIPEASTSPTFGLASWAESSAENMGFALGTEPSIFVTHYAPDSSFCEEECPVLIVLGPDTMPGLNLTCFVDGVECATELVASQVLRVVVPAHSSGVVPMWLIGKDVQGTVVTHSDSFAFYYLPSARDGALSFAHATSHEYFTSDVFFKFRHTTRELDLTGNNLTNLDFLTGFSELKELILDHNALTHWAHFPSLPKLVSISVNNNHILQIDMFLAQLQQAGLATKLKYLSTLGNAANPSFDRLEHRYYNFRIYIISKLPNLKLLDMRDVTDAERAHSKAIAEEEQQLQQLQDSSTHSSTASPDSVPYKDAGMDDSVVESAFRTLSASPLQGSALSDPTFIYGHDHFSSLTSSGGHSGML